MNDRTHPSGPGSLAPAPFKIARIIERADKGSDVNLASYVILDGCKRDYDLAEPIRNDLGLRLNIVNPRKAVESHRRSTRKCELSDKVRPPISGITDQLLIPSWPSSRRP